MSADRWLTSAQNQLATAEFCYKKGDWRGAYGAYGTATEYLLKSIYLRNLQVKVLPNDLKTATSHDLNYVATRAGLTLVIGGLSKTLRVNWLVVRDWDQTWRYPNGPFPAREARELRKALLSPSNGVWQWLLDV